jgi:D-glucosaminate-6-phosphate ammonia-lyase
VILFASQRSAYEPCLRAAGARLVVVDDTLASLRDRLGPEVAAVFYDAQPAKLGAAPDLAEVVRAAHAHDVPVIVDASLAVPPRENLTALVASGADLVAFSGSKTIGGPGASGFLAGREDLIESALAQQADGDIRERLGLDRRPGPVQMGIGRVTKTGKEEIVGLLFALDRYTAHEPLPSGCDPQLVLAALAAIDGVDARLEELADGIVVKVTVDGVPARKARDALLAGDPPVAVLLVGEELMLRATSLRAGEVEPLAGAFAQLRTAR